MIFVPQSVSDNNIGANTFHAFNQEGFQYLVYPLRMQPETVLVAPTGTILALYCTVLVVVCFFLSLTCSTSIVLPTGLILVLYRTVLAAPALFCWLDPYLYCNVLVAPAVFCWQHRCSGLQTVSKQTPLKVSISGQLQCTGQPTQRPTLSKEFHRWLSQDPWSPLLWY